MSIEERKLFRFVSKLIFDTNRGDIKWEKSNKPQNISLSDIPFVNQTVSISDYCFSTLTPDGKKLFLLAKSNKELEHREGLRDGFLPRSQCLKRCLEDVRLRLYAEDGKLELSINLQSVNSLADLYQAILFMEDKREIENFDKEIVTTEAAQTIDLMLNANKETITHRNQVFQ
ncbi:MAG: hypothetical protein FWC50_06800 [Planctomycetaceae bacterium]|nr:hypothetical protein [Planctomycetaceae bacterium]